jgi:transposase
MFVRTKTSPNTKKIAVQLVENERIGNKVKQKVIRHFGNALNQQEVEALTKLAINYKIELENGKEQFLFDKDTIASLTLTKRPKVDDNTTLDVNLKNIKEEKRITLGIHEFYGSIFDDIGFNKALKNPARKKASVAILRDMVMARISMPASKRQSVDMLQREYDIHIDVNSVYRAMDYLDEEAIQKINKLAYKHTTGLIGEPVNVVFYDCTTLYFESFTEDTLKQKGYSKDGKFNQVQVLLSIIVTQSGLPLGYELFEGNTFEGKTLENALEKLKKTYQIEKVVFVADSGLLNKNNISLLENDKQEYILGARIKNVSAELTKEILDKDTYKPLYSNQENNEEEITYKEIILEDKNQKLIVSYSPSRAQKDKYDREKALEQLGKRIGKNKNPKSLLSNYGYKKFIKVEGESKLVIDDDKIKEAQQWDGLHGIYTNIKNANPVDILKHYKGLWQVEETFRISKHDLSMRPIFHWTPKRIKSHIAICFMALVCVRIAEYRIALQYKKLSPRAIKTALLGLQISILKDHATNKIYALPSRATQDAKKIYQLIGLKWTDTPYLVK